MSETRVGTGMDAHAFADGRALVLGGVTIPYDRGLAGHSDADVLTHAIIDAVLGGAGMGDIGTRFPSGDERFRDADSLALLRTVATEVREAGWQVTNVDAVVIAERPAVAPHRDLMRARLAEALQVEPGRISVKATTTDGMGFTGRGEGIAVTAVALLMRERLPDLG